MINLIDGDFSAFPFLKVSFGVLMLEKRGLVIRNSANNRHVTFFPVELSTTCPQTTHMLR